MKIDEVRKSIKELSKNLKSCKFLLEKEVDNTEPPQKSKLECSVNDEGITIYINSGDCGASDCYMLTDDEAIELYNWLHELYVL